MPSPQIFFCGRSASIVVRDDQVAPACSLQILHAIDMFIVINLPLVYQLCSNILHLACPPLVRSSALLSFVRLVSTFLIHFDIFLLYSAQFSAKFNSYELPTAISSERMMYVSLA